MHTGVATTFGFCVSRTVKAHVSLVALTPGEYDSVRTADRGPTRKGVAGLVSRIPGTRLLTVDGSSRPAGASLISHVSSGTATLVPVTHAGLHGRTVTRAGHGSTVAGLGATSTRYSPGPYVWDVAIGTLTDEGPSHSSDASTFTPLHPVISLSSALTTSLHVIVHGSTVRTSVHGGVGPEVGVAVTAYVRPAM